MICGSKESSITKIITDALPNTPYSQVFQNNMDETSYINDIEERFKHLSNEPQRTLLISASNVRKRSEYADCQVNPCVEYCMKIDNFIHYF